jgi:hypothetical protein
MNPERDGRESNIRPQEAAMNSKDDRDILEVLKFELDFIESGGYGRLAPPLWKTKSAAEAALSCLSSSDPTQTCPCHECLLASFVPPDRRLESVPCHYIPLTATGEGIDALEGWCEKQELEEFVKIWLRKTIRQLQEERSKRVHTAKATAGNEA